MGFGVNTETKELLDKFPLELTWPALSETFVLLPNCCAKEQGYGLCRVAVQV